MNTTHGSGKSTVLGRLLDDFANSLTPLQALAQTTLDTDSVSEVQLLLTDAEEIGNSLNPLRRLGPSRTARASLPQLIKNRVDVFRSKLDSLQAAPQINVTVHEHLGAWADSLGKLEKHLMGAIETYPIDRSTQLLKEEAHDNELDRVLSIMQEVAETFRVDLKQPYQDSVWVANDLESALRRAVRDSDFQSIYSQASKSYLKKFDDLMKSTDDSATGTGPFPAFKGALRKYLDQYDATDVGHPDDCTNLKSEIQQRATDVISPLSNALSDLKNGLLSLEAGAFFAKERTPSVIDDDFEVMLPNRIQAVRTAASAFADPFQSELLAKMNAITNSLPALKQSYQAMETEIGKHWNISEEEAKKRAWSRVARK